MAGLLDHLGARLARWHAAGVFARFQRSLRRVESVQQSALREVLAHVRGSDLAHACDLGGVRTLADFRRAAPLHTYDDLRPYLDRLLVGDTTAVFRPGQQIRMFATSSGTTAIPKHIPVTPAFIRQYRRGWNTFGLKMLSDHPDALLRSILQSSSRYDERRTAQGIPCGAITGLLARTQKRIVRRFYVGAPAIAELDDPRARYYALMRFAAPRDVSFAITANPATLIEMAKVMDEHADHLVCDLHDGSVSDQIVTDPVVRRKLDAVATRDATRARELESLRRRHGALRPRDVWRLSFLACWTAGSLSHYLPRLRELWGELPIRDVGLLASEGRVTIPLDDDTPVGVLDVQAAVFEFIPLEQADQPQPTTLMPHELTPGKRYVVVLSNVAGLVRYRLDDVVRCHGFMHDAPLLEFLHRAGRVSSVTGEKLTENQVASAVRTSCETVGSPPAEFLCCPVFADPPFYRMRITAPPVPELATAIDQALARENSEYADRRRSGRLGPLQLTSLQAVALDRMDERLLRARSGRTEQYKRQCLFRDERDEAAALGSLGPLDSVSTTR